LEPAGSERPVAFRAADLQIEDALLLPDPAPQLPSTDDYLCQRNATQRPSVLFGNQVVNENLAETQGFRL
jgi:hypothetical protein